MFLRSIRLKPLTLRKPAIRRHGFTVTYDQSGYKTPLIGNAITVRKHLKIAHHVDPEANGVAQKRDENNTAVYAALLRHAEINKAQKAQDEAQKKE